MIFVIDPNIYSDKNIMSACYAVNQSGNYRKLFKCHNQPEVPVQRGNGDCF
uniref:Uncharacterized protein n=1 Tax=Salmonella sp. 96A-29192 TaxID=1179814 RepID=I3VZP1_9ENTR|nr:hypothetical protein [Salmonella sp. 96A-29192]